MFSINKPNVISRTRPHLLHGHNLNKLGKGLLCDYTRTKYQALGLVVSEKISCFPNISLYKTCDSQGAGVGSFLAPGA